jgi:eukaryotic-like serine/threonine-protein kinase
LTLLTMVIDGGVTGLEASVVTWGVSMAVPLPRPPQVLDRYVMLEEIASGGMATVHFGRLLGAAGFARPVAIKRLHPHFARDPEFASMLIDEARVAARVLHPNVVPTLDVVSQGAELFLVMEYVPGASLSTLLDALRARHQRAPPEIALGIMIGTAFGLHAAHEATTERGEPLAIVHRDVSPQNVLVGFDGVARVHDFGIAKAVGRLQTTRQGQLKGKLRYMAPEQLRGQEATRQTDVYSAAVVLWEVLTGERLFDADNDAALFGKVLEGIVAPPSSYAPGLPPALDSVLACGLDREPRRRFATARELALALGDALRPAPASEIGEYLESVLGAEAARRARRASEPAHGCLGDDEPTLPSSRPSAPPAERGAEPAPRALPAGWLAPAPAPAAVRPASEKTRTETVQRVAPFALAEEASGSTRALASSVRPPRPRRRTTALGASALVAAAGIGAALLLRAGPVPARYEAARLVPASEGLRIEEPSEQIQIDDLSVQPVARRAQRSRPRGVAHRRTDCEKLYTTDPNGIRRVKRNCL